MIHVIYGEDIFQVRGQVNDLKKSAEEAGADTIMLDAKELSANTLEEHLQAGNLFSKRTVLVIRNLLSQANAALKDRAANLLETVPKDTDVILWEEGIPDRRTSLFRMLQKKAKISEKIPLKGSALTQWIQNHARSIDLGIDQKAIVLLAQSSGSDLAQLEQELTKLKNFVGDRQATEQDVNELVSGSVPPSIFELLDRLGGSSTDASLLVERLLSSGEEPLYLLSMLAYQLRTLILVSDLRLHAPHITSIEVARKLGMHPFVAQKTLQQVQHFSIQDLVALHRRLTEIDIQIKTGAVDPADALFLLVGQHAVG